MNVRILIAYHGANYRGWAIQPGVPTIEGTLRRAIATLLNVETTDFFLQGASRTDAGVHAVGQVANIEHQTNRGDWDFVRGLNGLTPESIAIWHSERVADDFNARHNSTGKRYRYRIWPHRFLDPLRRGQTWWVKHKLDIEKMQQACPHFVGEHDFSSFRASDCQALTTERELYRVEFELVDDEFVLWVEGTAFLKYMVRNIAGTLVDVGRGIIEPDDIPDILQAADRSAAGQTAPPHGLTLMEVFYENHPWARTPRVGVDHRY